MRYSRELLDQMAKKVNLLEYASKKVDFVRRSGTHHYAVCPFHDEKTASLCIEEGSDHYHCFGCGERGDIYDWIQKTENVGFTEAVRKVAGLTDTEISEIHESESMGVFKELAKTHQPKEDKGMDRTVLDINRDYNDRFSDEIPQEWVDEGISPESMRKYQIRIDNTSNRIVYPVYDNNLNFVGIKGRTRLKNYKDLRIMKYMNYTKIGTTDFFAGMRTARPHIQKSGTAIVVEGLKSVMKLDGWGYHNGISAETSMLNEAQIVILIQMHVNEVVIAFDTDVKLNKIRETTKQLRRYTNVSVVRDKHKWLGEKMSPVDRGRDIWEQLYRERERI